MCANPIASPTSRVATSPHHSTATRTNPYYAYGRGGAGDNAAAGYSSYEIDLIAARYASGPLPYPSTAGAFDAQVGTRQSAEGESNPCPVRLIGWIAFPTRLTSSWLATPATRSPIPPPPAPSTRRWA